MTKCSIPYGRDNLQFQVDDKRLVGVLRPMRKEGERLDAKAIVRKALENPIGSKKLRTLAADKQHILIVTSDHTRPLPSAVTMPELLSECRSENPDVEIVILVATGLHRSPTDQELREKFTHSVVDAERIVVHTASDEVGMRYFGNLPSGGELWLNELVNWADLIISEGFIEPHFFAGYSGGRKSILPGIASEKTVLYNHNANFIKNPLAVQGSLNKNPIQDDMQYAAKQVGLAFILNVLLDDQQQVSHAFAGDPFLAHSIGCEVCAQQVSVASVTADIVITSNGGYPLDQNIYQSVKGMTAAETCVRQDGVIIMCAALGDGHGGENFYNWFATSESPKEILDNIERVPSHMTTRDQWQAQILARVLSKARGIFVTGSENRALVEGMNMRWASDVQSAIDAATELLGNDSSIAVIPNGVNVIMRKGGHEGS